MPDQKLHARIAQRADRTCTSSNSLRSALVSGIQQGFLREKSLPLSRFSPAVGLAHGRKYFGNATSAYVSNCPLTTLTPNVALHLFAPRRAAVTRKPRWLRV